MFADIAVHKTEKFCNALDYRVDRNEQLKCPTEWMDSTTDSFAGFKNRTHWQSVVTCNPKEVCSRSLVIEEYSYTDVKGNKTISYNVSNI